MNTTSARPPHPDEPGLRPIRPDDAADVLAAFASATVADWALTDGGLDRLELGHRVNNPASESVARTAGFVPEGLERRKLLVEGDRVDVLTYGRLVDDPWPTVARLPLEHR